MAFDTLGDKMSTKAIQAAQKEAERAIAKLVATAMEAEKVAAAGMHPLQPVKDCYAPIGRVATGIEAHKQAYTLHATAMQRWNAQLSEAWAEVETIHAQNEEALRQNAETDAALRALFQMIGLPADYTETALVRGRWKSATVASGWVGDLRRFIKLDDGYARAVRQKGEIERRMAEAERKEAERVAAEKRAAEAAAFERKRVMLAVEVCQRWGIIYEPGEPVCVEDVIDRLVEPNSYLALAHGLMLNREDWNDGYNLGQRALDAFRPVTEEDAEMVASIQADIDRAYENGDIDGRLFRDCEWNYNRIFAKAAREEPERYADYQKLLEVR